MKLNKLHLMLEPKGDGLFILKRNKSNNSSRPYWEAVKESTLDRLWQTVIFDIVKNIVFVKITITYQEK